MYLLESLEVLSFFELFLTLTTQLKSYSEKYEHFKSEFV